MSLLPQDIARSPHGSFACAGLQQGYCRPKLPARPTGLGGFAIEDRRRRRPQAANRRKAHKKAPASKAAAGRPAATAKKAAARKK